MDPQDRPPEPGQTGAWRITRDEDARTIQVHLQSWTANELKWQTFELTDPDSAYRFFRDGLMQTLYLDPSVGSGEDDDEDGR